MGSPVNSESLAATPAKISLSCLVSKIGLIPPLQTCRKGLEQEAVISGKVNSIQLWTGKTTSAYSQLAVHSSSLYTIISTLLSTLAIMLWAHLALLSRLPLPIHPAVVVGGK